MALDIVTYFRSAKRELQNENILEGNRLMTKRYITLPFTPPPINYSKCTYKQNYKDTQLAFTIQVTVLQIYTSNLDFLKKASRVIPKQKKQTVWLMLGYSTV